ncbi:MAG: hypothetical protein NXI32_19080 [bacterium]|nr:hypothetical protein [bacterium]
MSFGAGMGAGMGAGIGIGIAIGIASGREQAYKELIEQAREQAWQVTTAEGQTLPFASMLDGLKSERCGNSSKKSKLLLLAVILGLGVLAAVLVAFLMLAK